MNKEEIVIDNGHLIHYLNDHEFYEYDTLDIDTLNYLDRLQRENKQLKELIKQIIYQDIDANGNSRGYKFYEDLDNKIAKKMMKIVGDSNE